MSKQLVECVSVPCRLPEEIAREIDALYKTLPTDCEFIRKSYTPDAIQFEPGERAEVSIITTSTKDYSNEVILAKGVNLDPYRKHMRVLWNHHRDLPGVGECQWIKLHSDETIRAKTLYPERQSEGDRPWYIDEIWDMISSRPPVLNGKSIGLLPTKPKRAPTPEELAEHPEWEGAGIWEEGVMLEYSVVPVGCNPEAVLELVNNKSFNAAKVKELESQLGVILPVVEKTIEVAKPECPCLYKNDECVSNKIKFMNDSGESSKYSQAQIVAIAYHHCHQQKSAPKPIVRKQISEKEIMKRVLKAMDVNRIIRLANKMHSQRGTI